MMPASVSIKVAQQNFNNTLAFIEEEYPQFDPATVANEIIDIREWQEERIPISVVANNSSVFSEYLDEPLFGVKITDRLNLSDIPAMKLLKALFPVSNEPEHIGEMIIFLTEYFATLTESIDIHLTWQKDCLRMDISPCDDYVNRHQVEGAVHGICKAIHFLTHSHPINIQFSHPSKTEPSNYNKFFYVEPVFGRNGNAIVYRAKQRFCELDEPAINAVSGLSLILQEEFPHLGVVEQCKTILKSIMHFGEPSRERVSGMLHMSVSTLQRKLREQGQSFKDILLSLRKELADDMLTKQKLTATQTAFLLGYHSETQFFKAFKSWFGVTPGQYKEQAIQGMALLS